MSLLTGWPSFSDVADKANVAKIRDTTHGMVRVEVVCAKVQCGPIDCSYHNYASSFIVIS